MSHSFSLPLSLLSKCGGVSDLPNANGAEYKFMIMEPNSKPHFVSGRYNPDISHRHYPASTGQVAQSIAEKERLF